MVSVILTYVVMATALWKSQAQEESNFLERRWNVSGPVFKYEDLQFDMTFTTSDFIQDSMVEYRLYDGHNCKDGNGVNEAGSMDITENNFLLSRMRPDLAPLGDGNGSREMKVTLNLVPDLVTNSSIYEDNESTGVVKFCLRFSVYNLERSHPESMEVNFLEVPVVLTIDLSSGFTIDLEINSADSVVQKAYDDTAVEAYLCDNEANIIEFDSRQQGQTIRVCVVPTEETLKDGGYLRYIEEFTFTRDDLSQVAISPGNGGAAADDLTVVSCFSGATICAFETLLNSAFFDGGIGVVLGTGKAFLQIGQGPIEAVTTRRRLQENNGKSPDSLLAERPTNFQLEVVAIPEESSNKPVISGAISATEINRAVIALGVTMLASYVFA